MQKIIRQNIAAALSAIPPVAVDDMPGTAAPGLNNNVSSFFKICCPSRLRSQGNIRVNVNSELAAAISITSRRNGKHCVNSCPAAAGIVQIRHHRHFISAASAANADNADSTIRQIQRSGSRRRRQYDFISRKAHFFVFHKGKISPVLRQYYAAAGRCAAVTYNPGNCVAVLSGKFSSFHIIQSDRHIIGKNNNFYRYVILRRFCQNN